jgi:hypothetical protein
MPETVPVINSDGELLLAASSPAIKAKSGNFLIEGQAVTLKTTDGAGGNIEINPDGNGITHFLFEGTGKNFLNAQAPNLTSGSLFYGVVANNSTGYDLLRLQSGSKPITKLSVDGAGNTSASSGTGPRPIRCVADRPMSVAAGAASRAEECLVGTREPLRAADAVAALLILDDGRYVMQLRDTLPTIFYPDHWGCFGGAVGDGEAPLAALNR